MIDVPMPQLGESVAEGTVTKWLVREGDFVDREQVLLEVATDKADTEVRAPSGGRVVSLIAKEGQTLATGTVLAKIDETATKAAGAAAAPAAKPAAPPQQAAPQQAAPPAPPSGNSGQGLASPSTRRMALEHGVDVNRVQGTGEQGRVTHDDVRRAAGGTALTAPTAPQVSQPAPQAAAPTATPTAVELSQLLQAGAGFVPPIPGVGYGSYKVPPFNPKPGDQIIPFNRRRQITADHMVYSKQVSPHVATVAEVDLYATAKLRDQHKDRLKKEGVPLTFLAFICAATVRALRENPTLNARVLEKSYAVIRDINLGVAVDTPGGLVVPSIKHADQLSLRGIASAIDELAQRAKAGKVTADDLAGTTFSVSNPGLKGNLFGAAIISQPNVGILRMGEIKKRPVVVTNGDEDTIAIHPVMYVALSYDHRIIDGVAANSFLWRVADLLSRADFEVG
ncbi:MAG: 2-oxo acid dehydrogenase subunit E2 [Polyangiaceae bacterium]|nr:2-oxo acid dehydrogenase subunit E2 [Polyangiaceae bacterium]